MPTAYIHRHNEGQEMPKIDVSELLNRTFITNPDENGEQLRVVIDKVEKTK